MRRKLTTLFLVIIGISMVFGQGIVKRRTMQEKKDTVQVKNNKPKAKKETLPSGNITAKSKKVLSEGTLELDYGVWTGSIKNNKPHGKGRLTFNTTYTIDKYSSSVANPYDYLIATYENGKLISGKL